MICLQEFAAVCLEGDNVYAAFRVMDDWLDAHLVGDGFDFAKYNAALKDYNKFLAVIAREVSKDVCDGLFAGRAEVRREIVQGLSERGVIFVYKEAR